jgi:hypothetical protein
MDRFLAAARHGDILGDIPTIQKIYEVGAASIKEADREGMVGLALAAHMGRDMVTKWNSNLKAFFGEEASIKWSYIIDYQLFPDGRDWDRADNTCLFKVIAVMGASPGVIEKLKPRVEHTEPIEKGRQLFA